MGRRSHRGGGGRRRRAQDLAHKNGTYGNSGDPSTNTNGVDYITTAAVFACAHLRDALEAVTINTGGAAFSYSIPTGFAAWG